MEIFFYLKRHQQQKRHAFGYFVLAKVGMNKIMSSDLFWWQNYNRFF